MSCHNYDVDRRLTFRRPVHARYIICSDRFRHGHEHLDRLLFDGDTYTHGVEITPSEGKEDHSRHHVQWWPARDGFRHTPLCLDFDCLFHPKTLKLFICPQTNVHAHQVGDTDPSQSGYWSVRESFVSFVLTNMPMLYPLLKSFLQKIGTTLALTNNNDASGQSTNNVQAYRLGSYPNQHKKTRNKDPNPVPEESRYGSDEHIVSLGDDSCDAGSSGEGAAVDEQSRGRFHVAAGFEPARVTVCSGPGPSDGRRPTPVDHTGAGGIIVTREYNVSEDRRMNDPGQNDRAFLDV